MSFQLGSFRTDCRINITNGIPFTTYQVHRFLQQYLTIYIFKFACRIGKVIAYVSRFMTLKIGDLLFTGTPAGVGPVSVGQHLQGYLGGEKLLDFHIR